MNSYGIVNSLLEIISKKELFGNLIIRNLKIRYKNSYLGFLWSLLDPLFMMIIYLIFIKILRFSIDFPNLLLGVLAWHFTSLTLNDSVACIPGHTSIVKRVYFPRIMVPFSIIIANFMNFLLSILVFITLMIVFNYQFSFQSLLFSFPFIIVIHLALCLGISALVSTLGVFFNDMEHIVRVVQMAWFFISPIIYPLDVVPSEYRTLYMYNPLASLFTLYRKVLINGSALTANMDLLIYSLLSAALIFLLGMMLFLKLEKYFADEL